LEQNLTWEKEITVVKFSEIETANYAPPIHA